MLNHLLKRCPSMTQDDRDLAFLHMQHTSNGPGKSKKQASGDHTSQQNTVLAQPRLTLGALQGLGQEALPNNPVTEHRQQMPPMMQQSSQEGPPANIPLHMLMQRQQSALDTLAEVSRRHMDYSTHSLGYANDLQHLTMSKQADRGLVEHALLAALQRQDNTDGIAPRPVEPMSMSMSMYPSYVAQAQTGAEQASFPEAPISLSLVHNVPAVSRQMEQSNFQINEAPIDPQLDEPTDNDKPTLSDQKNEASRQSQDEFIMWTEAPQDFVTQQEPPSNEPNPDFITSHKSDKTTARARFTDSRRKEVQEVRKRGACMRCRMLKKPCSEGTPCGTCKKIDSARLWKGTCLRTKLAEEFTLYSTSYFQSQMVASVQGAVRELKCEPSSSSVEVKFVPHSALAIILETKRYSNPKRTQHIGDSAQPNETAHSTADQDVVVLVETMTSQKVSACLMNDKILQDCISNEKSGFLEATMQEAVALLQAEKSQEKPSSVKAGSRTNHISPSVLVSNVIELWVATNILVLVSQEPLQIRYSSGILPGHGPQTVSWPEGTGQPALVISSDSPSYKIIRAQLLAATEATCHRLSKAVMNELERRLLQRQQVSAFATFISAVILLSCIERITSLFYSLDPSVPPSTASEIITAPPLRPSPDARPLGYPSSMPAPSTLWPQGQHFARLLTTLLRMRALPPRTTRTADNKLAVLREPGLPVRLNGVAVREQQDTETTRAACWLDALELDIDMLRAKRDGNVASVGWEMKLVSEVLLGEGM